MQNPGALAVVTSYHEEGYGRQRANRRAVERVAPAVPIVRE